MDAIRLFQGDVSEDVLLKEPLFETLRKRLLGGAADFHVKLATLLRGQSDRRSLTALARSYADLGILMSKVGSQPEAHRQLRNALALGRQLVSLPAAGPDEKTLLAELLSTLGDQLRNQSGERERALEAAREARDLMIDVVRREPSLPAYRAGLAAACRSLSSSELETGQRQQARVHLDKAIAIYEDLVAQQSGPPEYRPALASSYIQLADLIGINRRMPELEHLYLSAIDLAEALAGSTRMILPISISQRRPIAVIRCTSNGSAGPGRHSAIERAAETSQAKVKSYPVLTSTRFDLAPLPDRDGHQSRQARPARPGNRADGAWRFDPRETRQENPGDISVTSQLAWHSANLGALCGDAGRLPEARLFIRESPWAHETRIKTSPFRESDDTLSYIDAQFGYGSRSTDHSKRRPLCSRGPWDDGTGSRPRTSTSTRSPRRRTLRPRWSWLWCVSAAATDRPP